MSGKSARTLGEELYYLDKSRERCLKRLTNKITRKINWNIRPNVKYTEGKSSILF